MTAVGAAASGRARAQSRDRPRRDLAGATLAERLRAETHDAHVAAERAFDLDRRLDSLRGYGDVLLVLDERHQNARGALSAVAGALPPLLRDGPARRRARLVADLATLGRLPSRRHRERPHAAHVDPDAAVASDPDSEVDVASDADLDRALGAWYVHEGAALGGLLIAAEVRRRLPQAAGAATFFAGEGRATAARWRIFQGALARWPDDDATHGRVVAGALQEFSAFSGMMVGMSR